MDALVRDQAEPSAMVSIYALISQMRMASNANVVGKAEAVIRTILGTYSRPNKTFPELRDMVNRGAHVRVLVHRPVYSGCSSPERGSGSPGRRRLEPGRELG